MGTVLHIVASYHVEVHVTLHPLDFGEVLDKVLRTEQTFLLSIPKGEYYGLLRLLPGSHEGLENLKYGLHTRSIVVCSVEDFVALKQGVVSQMVVVCTHNDNLLRVLSFYLGKYVAHWGCAVWLFLQPFYLHVVYRKLGIPTLRGVDRKRLFVSIFKEWSCPHQLQDGNQVFSSDVSVSGTRLTSHKSIRCKKLHVCLGGISVYALQSLFFGSGFLLLSCLCG